MRRLLPGSKPGVVRVALGYLTWRAGFLLVSFMACLALGVATLPGLLISFLISSLAGIFLLADRRAALAQALLHRQGRRIGAGSPSGDAQ